MRMELEMRMRMKMRRMGDQAPRTARAVMKDEVTLPQ